MNTSFQNRLDSAAPGDVIALPPGVYRDIQLTLKKSGQPGLPVTLRAATPGTVFFTGHSQLLLAANHLLVEGIVFDQCWPGPEQRHVVLFKWASHCRLTQCAFVECGNPQDTGAQIIMIRADSCLNRVDHCLVLRQLSMSMAVCQWEGDEFNHDNRFDHNWFRDMDRRPGQTMGYCAIQIGQGSHKHPGGQHTVIEHNLFDNGGRISVKAGTTRIAANTFLGGSDLVVRHGADSVVQDNVFLQEDGEGCAIRVHGTELLVTRNRIEGFAVGLQAPNGGDAVPGLRLGGTRAYDPVSGCSIIANTFTRCTRAAIELATHNHHPDVVTQIPSTGNLVAANTVIDGPAEHLPRAGGNLWLDAIPADCNLPADAGQAPLDSSTVGPCWLEGCLDRLPRIPDSAPIPPFAGPYQDPSRLAGSAETKAERMKRNLACTTFPGIPADYLREPEAIPLWWQSSLDEVNAFLDARIVRGKVFTYGTSAGGFPLRAVAYGRPRQGEGTSTFSGAIGCSDIRSYLGPVADSRVLMILAGLHGGEFEPIVGALNLLSVLETGSDLAGRPQSELASRAAALDRIVIIPVANPDGRARVPVRMECHTGEADTLHDFFNCGAWLDGKHIGWPFVKEHIPLDFSKTCFPGGYPNGAGVNLQHDDFMGSPQPETRALFDLAALERPDLVLNLHTGVPTDNYFMRVHHPLLEPALDPIWKSFYRHVHTALTQAGLQSTRDPALEADPVAALRGVYNLDTALNLHCGALCVVVESPSHSYTCRRRDGTPAPREVLPLLDAQLTLYAAAADFLATSGGRARWLPGSRGGA